MKKIALLITIIAFGNQSFSQSNIPGRFSLSAGFDAGIHYTISESKYNGTVIGQDTSGAATKLFQFNAHYSFAKWFSAGLGFRKGSYLEDPNDPESKYESNTVGEFYLDTRFYFVNKNKFNMYGGFSLGSTRLNYNYTQSPIIITQDYAGPSVRLGIGLNWYISKFVGFWFNTDYAGRNFTLSNYVINGANQDLTNWNFSLKTKGVHLTFGVCIKFKS